PSGGSIISWAELLKHQPRPASEDEVMLGSLPELQIDAQSDNEIIKSLQKEGSKSGYLRSKAGKSSSHGKSAAPGKSDPPKPAPPAAKDGSLAAKVFAGKPSETEDWYRGAEHHDSSIDLMTAAKDANNPATEPPSNRESDSSDVLSAAIRTDDGTSAVDLGQEPRASGLHSWNVANPPPSLVPPQLRAKPAPSKPQATLRRPRSLPACLGGAAAGVAGTALLGAGLWFGGVFSPGKKDNQTAASAPAAAAKPSPDQARRHLEVGEL